MVVGSSCEDHEAGGVQALTPAHWTLGRLAQSRALFEDEFAGQALRRFDTQALAAVPERARQVLEVARDVFLADSHTRRDLTSRERPLPEDLPQRRPDRFVSLGELVSAWPFRQWVHLSSKQSCGVRSHYNTLDALDIPASVERHLGQQPNTP